MSNSSISIAIIALILVSSAGNKNKMATDEEDFLKKLDMMVLGYLTRRNYNGASKTLLKETGLTDGDRIYFLNDRPFGRTLEETVKNSSQEAYKLPQFFKDFDNSLKKLCTEYSTELKKYVPPDANTSQKLDLGVAQVTSTQIDGFASSSSRKSSYTPENMPYPDIPLVKNEPEKTPEREKTPESKLTLALNETSSLETPVSNTNTALALKTFKIPKKNSSKEKEKQQHFLEKYSANEKKEKEKQDVDKHQNVEKQIFLPQPNLPTIPQIQVHPVAQNDEKTREKHREAKEKDTEKEKQRDKDKTTSKHSTEDKIARSSNEMKRKKEKDWEKIKSNSSKKAKYGSSSSSRSSSSNATRSKGGYTSVNIDSLFDFDAHLEQVTPVKSPDVSNAIKENVVDQSIFDQNKISRGLPGKQPPHKFIGTLTPTKLGLVLSKAEEAFRSRKRNLNNNSSSKTQSREVSTDSSRSVKEYQSQRQSPKITEDSFQQQQQTIQKCALLSTSQAGQNVPYSSSSSSSSSFSKQPYLGRNSSSKTASLPFPPLPKSQLDEIFEKNNHHHHHHQSLHRASSPSPLRSPAIDFYESSSSPPPSLNQGNSSSPYNFSSSSNPMENFHYYSGVQHQSDRFPGQQLQLSSSSPSDYREEFSSSTLPTARTEEEEASIMEDDDGNADGYYVASEGYTGSFSALANDNLDGYLDSGESSPYYVAQSDKSSSSTTKLPFSSSTLGLLKSESITSNKGNGEMGLLMNNLKFPTKIDPALVSRVKSLVQSGVIGDK